MFQGLWIKTYWCCLSEISFPLCPGPNFSATGTLNPVSEMPQQGQPPAPCTPAMSGHKIWWSSRSQELSYDISSAAWYVLCTHQNRWQPRQSSCQNIQPSRSLWDVAFNSQWMTGVRTVLWAVTKCMIWSAWWQSYRRSRHVKEQQGV